MQLLIFYLAVFCSVSCSRLNDILNKDPPNTLNRVQDDRLSLLHPSVIQGEEKGLSRTLQTFGNLQLAASQKRKLQIIKDFISLVGKRKAEELLQGLDLETMYKVVRDITLNQDRSKILADKAAEDRQTLNLSAHQSVAKSSSLLNVDIPIPVCKPINTNGRQSFQPLNPKKTEKIKAPDSRLRMELESYNSKTPIDLGSLIKYYNYLDLSQYPKIFWRTLFPRMMFFALLVGVEEGCKYLGNYDGIISISQKMEEWSIKVNYDSLKLISEEQECRDFPNKMLDNWKRVLNAVKSKRHHKYECLKSDDALRNSTLLENYNKDDIL